MHYHHPEVVPHRGTWIEMVIDGRTAGLDESYLTEVRGLKFILVDEERVAAVVPHRGTWIEMSRNFADIRILKSYLTEVRGLK